MPLRHLIALIINAHPSRRWSAANLPFESTSSLRRTLIRKTSLLHKIDPTALRSSFADICIARAVRRLASRSDRSPMLEIARRSVTFTAALGARIDLLFTMSDNTRSTRPKPTSARIKISHERVHAGSDQSRPVWWSQTGSNRRPPACKAGALPTELWPRTSHVDWLASRSPRQRAKIGVPTCSCVMPRRLVGLGRFELPTSRLSSARSNQLSYKPGPGISDQKSAIRTRLIYLIPDILIPGLGSFAKKEKRRRRRPANRPSDPKTDRP